MVSKIYAEEEIGPAPMLITDNYATEVEVISTEEGMFNTLSTG